MGARGPQPKEIRLKLLEGNPGRRPLSEQTAQSITPFGVGPPPEWMHEDAKEEWCRITEGTPGLSAKDYSALLAHCSNFALFISADKRLSDEGLLFADDEGKHYNMRLAERNNMLKALMVTSSKFGANPKDRASFHREEPEKPESKFGGLLKVV